MTQENLFAKNEHPNNDEVITDSLTLQEAVWSHYKPKYTPTQLEEVVAYYQSLANRVKIHGNSVENPFFAFTETGAPLTLRQQLPDGSVLRAGPVGAFSNKEVAAFLMTQQWVYVHRKTMGKKFPKNDFYAVEDLQAIMMANFDEDRLMVLYEKYDQEGNYIPLAGVQGFYGKSSRTLAEYFKVLDQNGDTTLSPFEAMVISKNSELLQHFLALWKELTEEEVFVVSRLFSQEDSLLRENEVTTTEVPWMVVAALAIAIEAQNQDRLESKQARIMMYDTHLPAMQTALELYFKMHLLAGATEIIPTKTVLDTILKHHYNDDGGYQNQIVIGFQEIQAFIQSSKAILARIGVDGFTKGVDARI